MDDAMRKVMEEGKRSSDLTKSEEEKKGNQSLCNIWPGIRNHRYHQLFHHYYHYYHWSSLIIISHHLPSTLPTMMMINNMKVNPVA